MTREEAERVKVSHFTKQGFSLAGVVHVGANDGYEIDFYFALGVSKVVVFEPVTKCFSELFGKWVGDDRVDIHPYALGRRTEVRTIAVTAGDGKGSSFLNEIGSDYEIAYYEAVKVCRFDELKIDLAGFDTLVVDVQGMELDVLVGFGLQLKDFSFLNIECSREPIYVGGVGAQQVIDFLAVMGFDQDSPIEDHDDIMFIKRGLK